VRIHGVKDEHLLPPFEVARCPVTRGKGEVTSDGRSRIGRGLGLGGPASNQSGGLEPTIDRRERRHRPDETTGAQFFLDGARTAQPNLCTLQLVAQAQDKLTHPLVISFGRALGRFGETVQRLPPPLLKALLPLEEPGARARDAFENLNGRFLFDKEPESQTAIANFVSIFLVHQTKKQVGMNKKKRVFTVSGANQCAMS
jgi:hypothetical protein